MGRETGAGLAASKVEPAKRVDTSCPELLERVACFLGGEGAGEDARVTLFWTGGAKEEEEISGVLLRRPSRARFARRARGADGAGAGT